ncbi:MAG: hypothetical protein QNI90_11055 [Dinoroseobacter sp.]|nr:hypothetical protein [Dinoroseobacter sp.]
MQLVAKNPDDTSAPPAAAPELALIEQKARGRLEVLRGALRRTRAASAMLADTELVSKLRGMPALDALCIRLSVLLGRPLRSFASGTDQLSFDEAWLLSVFEAMQRDDNDSYAFLLRTRLKRLDASDVHFLLCRARSALET